MVSMTFILKFWVFKKRDGKKFDLKYVSGKSNEKSEILYRRKRHPFCTAECETAEDLNQDDILHSQLIYQITHMISLNRNYYF